MPLPVAPVGWAAYNGGAGGFYRSYSYALVGYWMGLIMRTMTVADNLYAALETAAGRCGKSVQELVDEAIVSWLAEAAQDDAERFKIEKARAEAAEQGGVDFEAFFEDVLGNRG